MQKQHPWNQEESGERGPEGVHFGIYHEIKMLLSKRTTSDFLGEENT